MQQPVIETEVSRVLKDALQRYAEKTCGRDRSIAQELLSCLRSDLGSQEVFDCLCLDNNPF